MLKITSTLKQFLVFLSILTLGLSALIPLGGIPSIKAESKLLAIPSGFTIDIYNEKDVIILWEEPTDSRITDFAILRSEEAGKTPVEIARVPATTQTYVDDTVEVGKTYIYRVQSVGATYTSAETEPKSILVKKTEETLVTTPDPSAASSVDNLAKDTIGKIVGNQEPDQFIPNLLGIDLLIIGILLISYMTIRAIVNKKRKGSAADYNESKPTATAADTKDAEDTAENYNLEKVELKTGHKDKNIIQTAKKRFLKRKAANLKDWQKADGD